MQRSAASMRMCRLRAQMTKAEFHYSMPGRAFINREVVVTCVGGEWRAEG